MKSRPLQQIFLARIIENSTSFHFSGRMSWNVNGCNDCVEAPLSLSGEKLNKTATYGKYPLDFLPHSSTFPLSRRRKQQHFPETSRYHLASLWCFVGFSLNSFSKGRGQKTVTVFRVTRSTGKCLNKSMMLWGGKRKKKDDFQGRKRMSLVPNFSVHIWRKVAHWLDGWRVANGKWWCCAIKWMPLSWRR